MRIALAVFGIVVGLFMLGLAWNNHLTQTWDILTGQATTPAAQQQAIPPTKPARHTIFPPVAGIS